jgi:hypothetical protein
MTDKIKIGECNKKGKCEGVGYIIVMPVGNSGIFRSSCKINYRTYSSSRLLRHVEFEA